MCVSFWVERAGRFLWPQGTDPGPGGCHRVEDCTLKEGKALCQSALSHSRTGCCVWQVGAPCHKKCESKADAA